MNPQRIQESLIKHEGWKDTAYKDHLGNWTIGVGHLLSRPISPVAIKQILEDDIFEAVAELNRAFPDWNLHSDNVQNVLVELMFNLGAPNLGKFKKMWAALDERDYMQAAEEMLDSLWADQVGQRAETLADRMREG